MTINYLLISFLSVYVCVLHKKVNRLENLKGIKDLLKEKKLKKAKK